jgi:hypothetical protein
MIMLAGKESLKAVRDDDHHDVREKSSSLFLLSHMFPE